MRAATHHAAQIVRVSNVFQGQHAILRPGLTNPLLNSGTVTFFDQETNAAMVFSAGGFRQLGFVNHVVGFAVRRHPA